MRKVREILFLIVTLIAGLALTSWAADRQPDEKKAEVKSKEEGGFVIEKRGDTTIKYKKKTTYDFEGATIEGIHNKPSGAYISNIKDIKGKSVLKIRENFDSEVIDSARLVK